jgi:hypothetical protein
MSDQWLSIVEYARQFNMSDMTVRRRIKTGKIQAVLREGKYFIPAREAMRKLSTNPHQQPQPAAAQQQAIREHTPPLVKARPTPIHHTANHQATYQSQIPQPYRLEQDTHVDSATSVIPHHLRGGLQTGASMVDGTVLLAFCEASMRKSTEAEQRLEAQYRENIARLQSEINLRDQQIKSLAQQVEDLQLLTKILERKSRSQT